MGNQTFPQFRKYSNSLSYFKILSPLELEEIKIIGKYYQESQLKAIQLPDRNFVQDLIDGDSVNVLKLSQDEFETELKQLLISKVLLG